MLSDQCYRVSGKGRVYWPLGDANEANFLQTAPLRACSHSARRLAVLQVHTLCLRGIEEMLTHRDVDVSYETVRAWTVKFDPKIAANLRRRQLSPSPRWHLDEMVSKIAG